MCSRYAAIMLAVPLAANAAPVTFARDIAPIVYQYCAPCHRPGEAGPFSLLSYADAKSHARQIADVTRRRYMPPWAPESGYGDFSGARRLSDSQVALIAEWVGEGAPEGTRSETPPLPDFKEGWQLGAPDLIIEAQNAYALAAEGPDVYWNFILPASVSTTRYVRAIEIRPGDKRLVHHANLYVDKARSARRQEIAEGQGFPGMDVVIERTTAEPDDGHFLFWKPGGSPYVEPDGLAWRLDPGSDLVLNAHLQPSGKRESVRPSIGLYFTDHPAEKFPMLVELEHDGALDIPAGNRNFVVSDDFRLPLDVDVLAVYPHAHYLGHVLEGYATLPGGERKWLIRIPDWDPNWQGAYHYQEPVFLPKGSVISMRYHYDNSAANPRNPNQPPRRVVGGDQATDEMGHLWLQVLPRNGPGEKGDRRMELEEAVMRRRLEKYPVDFAAHFQLGALRLARLDPAEAMAMLRTALRIQPEHAEAHNLLGSALAATGRNTEAIEQFRAAVKARPDYGNARYNLARALARAGKNDEAIDNFEVVRKEFPSDTQVRDQLGELYLKQRRFAEALANEKNKTEATGEARWIEPRKPLPNVTLRTLEGKAWNLADLKGKTVVINLWATWCVPCRGELPEFQKLYEKLKSRGDVVVTSFNVDEDAAKIGPYLEENGLSFPVVLANDLTDAYFPVVFVPQTWFIDSTGKLLWMQEGYGGDANWQKTMTDKLDEVLNAR